MKVKGIVLKEAFASFLAAFLLLSLGLSSVFAQQETGQLIIKATDPNGAVVSGATVNVKSVDKGTALPATTTNDEGMATITNLQPGLYEVKVTGGGFAPYVQQAQVSVGAKLTVEAKLTAQAAAETVTVVAGEGGVEVNTQTQRLADIISQKQTTQLQRSTRKPDHPRVASGNVT